tara:strand:- start:6026 stop:6289 length:264 start_codon:yes stop_codon:yes gene_type:complete
MKNLTSYILCSFGFAAVIYLLWDKGIVVQERTALERIDGYTYKVEYKVTQYEQQKTKANTTNDLYHLKEDGDVLGGSGESSIWDWFN